MLKEMARVAEWTAQILWGKYSLRVWDIAGETASDLTLTIPGRS